PEPPLSPAVPGQPPAPPPVPPGARLSRHPLPLVCAPPPPPPAPPGAPCVAFATVSQATRPPTMDQASLGRGPASEPRLPTLPGAPFSPPRLPCSPRAPPLAPPPPGSPSSGGQQFCFFPSPPLPPLVICR